MGNSRSSYQNRSVFSISTQGIHPSGIVVGKDVSLVVLAPLFYYGGLIILILIGKARRDQPNRA